MLFIYQGKKTLLIKNELDKINSKIKELFFENNISKNINIFYIRNRPLLRYKNIIKNNNKYHILINNFFLQDLSDDFKNIFTYYLESYNCNNMKFLKVDSEYINNFYKKINIIKPLNKIKYGNEKILIILDNIGGWYLNKNDYINSIKYIYIKIEKLIKDYKNYIIEIRLHPKNRNDNNIIKNIKINFPKIKFNDCNKEENLDKVYCYFIQHSHLLYYYLYNSCLIYCLENDNLSYNYVLNDNIKIENYDLKKYLENRDRLFDLLINQSINFNNEYENTISNKIFDYLKN